MAKTLTITLPDALEQALTETAAQANQSAEDLILQLLTKTLIPSEFVSPLLSNSPTPDVSTDPLLQLAGCISSDVTDVAKNHDYYIGQALYAEMHRNE